MKTCPVSTPPPIIKWVNLPAPPIAKLGTRKPIKAWFSVDNSPVAKLSLDYRANCNEVEFTEGVQSYVYHEVAEHSPQQWINWDIYAVSDDMTTTFAKPSGQYWFTRHTLEGKL